MSIINSILKLLNLKEENLKISEDCIETRIIKKTESTVIKAKLAYKPKCCPKCNHIFDNKIKIFNYKTTLIKIPNISELTSYLELKKQRYKCEHCSKTFTLSTNIVAKGCSISNNTKAKIHISAGENKSEKQIAKENNVSHNTVSRIIESHYNKNQVNYNYLPETLCFDEFKSTKDCKGKMSFIFMDYNEGKIINIVENRRLCYLNNYFYRFSKHARENVKYIVIDMYAPYISLIKDVFPNAEIIFDRFHIVNLLTRALNKTRITTMNANKDGYNKLKRYYKFLLMPAENINTVDFKHYTCFKTWQSQETILDSLLEIDEELKDTYYLYQELLYAFQHKDYTAFYNIVDNFDGNISYYMKTSLKTLKKYKEYICNAMKYKPSNGLIEATNNTIKVLKRIAYGYRSFFNFRNRILIIHRNKSLTKKHA